MLKFFVTSTTNLLDAEATATVGHHVALPCNAVLRVINGIAAASTEGRTLRLPAVLIQPMAAEDVATAVARTAVGSPLNGTIEIAGPERLRFDEFIRRALRARDDPREVVADPQARYFGAELSERTLVPGDDARLGETTFDAWLRQSTTATAGPVSSGARRGAERRAPRRRRAERVRTRRPKPAARCER